MSEETTKSTELPDPAKRIRKPKVLTKPGKPRKKSAKRRNEAQQRVLDLIAARATADPEQKRLRVDSLVRTWIDNDTLLVEPDLRDLMWVQYRYMSPLERTELFTQEYIAAYRRAHARYCGDADTAAKKQPVDEVFVRNDMGDMNCLWYARATADALGVPYDMYLDAVMDGKLRNGKWIEPPLPNQLYARVDPARLRDRPTPAEISGRLYGPGWDSRFFADAYCGDPVQEAALTLLRVDVWGAPSPAARLSEYLVRRAISETRARAMFGQDLVDAVTIGGGQPSEPTVVAVSPYQPNCFGYPQGADASPCFTCSHVQDCWQYKERVRAALVAATGTDNPRLAREREQTAARQRAWYAKHKQAPKP